MQTTIRFPEELYIALKEEARRRGLTLNAYIIVLLWEKIRHDNALFTTPKQEQV